MFSSPIANIKVPKSLVVAGALVGLGTAIYMMWKKRSDPVEEANFISALYSNQVELLQLKNLSIRDQTAQFLQLDTIRSVEILVASACLPQYIAYTLASRTQRRKVLDNNSAAYEKEVIANLLKIDELIIRITQRILTEVGISYEKYEASIGKCSREGLPVKEVFSKLRENLRDNLSKINPQHRLSSEELLKIYSFAIKKYPAYKTSNAAYKTSLKEAVIEDLIFKEFKIESEELDHLTKQGLEGGKDGQEADPRLKILSESYNNLKEALSHVPSGDTLESKIILGKFPYNYIKK